MFYSKKQQTPIRDEENLRQLRITDNSLSFSLTQKAESNLKRMNDFDFSTRKGHATGSIVPSLPRLDEQFEQPSLNEELLVLQSKLNQLEEKFLNMSTPQKPRAANEPKQKPNALGVSKRTNLAKSKKTQDSESTSFNRAEERKDAETMRKEGTVGKIVTRPTTQFNRAALSKSAFENGLMRYNRGRDSLQRSEGRRSFDNKSMDSVRSIERSKNKEIALLQKDIERYRRGLESSRSKESKLQQKVETAEEKIKDYRKLEKEHRRLQEQHLKVLKMLQKSETIREKQKAIIQDYKAETKRLKQQLNGSKRQMPRH